MNFEKPSMPAESKSDEPKNYQDKLDNLKMMRDAGIGTYETAITDLMSLAKGSDPDGFGKKYYPGWKQEDFQRLLEELGEA